MRRTLVEVAILASVFSACAAAPVEHRHLDGVADPKRWSPAECEVSVSPHTVWEHPAFRMRIPVDFTTGEKQYPIGWPRMYLNLLPEEQAWQDYDRFEFQIYTETSRTNLPNRPLIFHLYNAQGQQKLITLDLAAIGAWKTFSVNVSDLSLTGNIARLGFNINEANYNDKDLVDFHIGGFRLARATVAQVTELKAVAPALFCDSRVLPFELVVEGPPDKLATGIPFQLRCGNRTTLAKTLPVARGRQTLYFPLADAKLDPGRYTLTACPDDATLRKEVTITVASSPWQKGTL